MQGFNLFAPLEKKKLARKDAKTQRGFFFAPLRLFAPNKK
jgi:hypothetical protein